MLFSMQGGNTRTSNGGRGGETGWNGGNWGAFSSSPRYNFLTELGDNNRRGAIKKKSPQNPDAPRKACNLLASEVLTALLQRLVLRPCSWFYPGEHQGGSCWWADASDERMDNQECHDREEVRLVLRPEQGTEGEIPALGEYWAFWGKVPFWKWWIIWQPGDHQAEGEDRVALNAG